jgi:competence protein ComEC
VTTLIGVRPVQVSAGALCLGLASANCLRPGSGLLAVALLALAVAFGLNDVRRIVAVAVALALFGLWWGAARLDALDASSLAGRIGTAARVRLVVTAPLQRGRYELRGRAVVLRFGDVDAGEPALLRLPPGRAPPQGAVLEGIGSLREPRGASNGFDERSWLRRQGIHVVLRLQAMRVVGRRGGFGRVADRIRRRLEGSVAKGVRGERAAVIEGVVLGADGGLSEELRERFRAAGLYHLLAVSGQNVALVAGGALLLAWLFGIPRFAGQLGALAAICAYVIAVGAQPSVIRAGIAGVLGILAWLTARVADPWHFLLLGAIALLAWNPYTLLDPGFQFSFAAVIAIFVLVPRWSRMLEGYPLGKLRVAVAASAACGLVTAPIGWAHFHSLQLLTVPANALAAPAVVPLLALALAAAAVAPFAPGAATALAWLNGWCAAYLIAVARAIGGLPFAQIVSTRSLLLLLSGALLAAAYACPARWRPSSSPST